MDFLGNSIDTVKGKFISLGTVIGTIFAVKNSGGRAKSLPSKEIKYASESFSREVCESEKTRTIIVKQQRMEYVVMHYSLTSLIVRRGTFRKG